MYDITFSGSFAATRFRLIRRTDRLLYEREIFRLNEFGENKNRFSKFRVFRYALSIELSLVNPLSMYSSRSQTKSRDMIITIFRSSTVNHNTTRITCKFEICIL